MGHLEISSYECKTTTKINTSADGQKKKKKKEKRKKKWITEKELTQYFLADDTIVGLRVVEVCK